VIDDHVRRRFLDAAMSDEESDLPLAALLLGRLEYREVDPAPYLAQLESLGAAAAARMARLGPLPDPHAHIDALNTFLYEDEGFTGNIVRYEDPRNSFLSDVLDRRTGIPISLAVVYVEVGRRAGLRLEGVNFPGHFLVRYRVGAAGPGDPGEIIIDAFHDGAILAEADVRQLLRKHLGDDAAFDASLLVRAGKRQILARMLQNLKRLYVSMRSFPQARATVDLLLDLDPMDFREVRDRGLLSYHLQDFRAALRDLERYFGAVPRAAMESDDEQKQEHEQVWEHLKTLRRRVASLN
jgi:regulator of sirC expression with transglutaminase-like and TPR domain